MGRTSVGGSTPVPPLPGVYWIGGGSGAGKSTVARRLADRHGLHLYSTDDVMADHAGRLGPAEAPHLDRFRAMDMDERWVRRSPQVMLETFHWFRGEGFCLIVEDLLRLSAKAPVLAEGFRLLPGLVEPLLVEPHHAVWLLPTPEFRVAAFDSRGPDSAIWGRTSDPERARENLLARDRLFTERLAVETRRLGLRSLTVDPAIGDADLTRAVGQALGLIE